MKTFEECISITPPLSPAYTRLNTFWKLWMPSSLREKLTDLTKTYYILHLANAFCVVTTKRELCESKTTFRKFLGVTQTRYGLVFRQTKVVVQLTKHKLSRKDDEKTSKGQHNEKTSNRLLWLFNWRMTGWVHFVR